MILKFYSLLSLLALMVFGCTQNVVDPEEATVTINFEHINNNEALVLDNIQYTNALGQDYSIKTIKYIVSRITFYNVNGTEYQSPNIHYVDIRDDATLTLELTNKMPYGTYTSISFVLGLVPEDNITGSLGIGLDRLMEWPMTMGGGYHYMKMEGEYIGGAQTSFFNFHTGGLGGRAYEIHVDLPLSNVSISVKDLKLNLVMEVSNWFKNPVDWDFEYWGSGIMGNPDAQETVQKNGQDIFYVTYPFETN